MALPEDLSLGHWNQMVDSFHQESDRGAAIIAGSFVEHALGAYLRYRTGNKGELAEKLFGATGPLSSFSQRIAVAYAFDLISFQFYADLEAIRKIRNHFAHHPMETTFVTQRVQQWIERLSLFRVAQETPEVAMKNVHRKAYIITCGFVSGSILDSIESNRKEPLTQPVERS